MSAVERSWFDLFQSYSSNLQFVSQLSSNSVSKYAAGLKEHDNTKVRICNLETVEHTDVSICVI
jgi:hypothetical protein